MPDCQIDSHIANKYYRNTLFRDAVSFDNKESTLFKKHSLLF